MRVELTGWLHLDAGGINKGAVEWFLSYFFGILTKVGYKQSMKTKNSFNFLKKNHICLFVGLLFYYSPDWSIYQCIPYSPSSPCSLKSCLTMFPCDSDQQPSPADLVQHHGSCFISLSITDQHFSSLVCHPVQLLLSVSQDTTTDLPGSLLRWSFT